ncbi:MAG TPA: ester cyclase [Actinomycetota bacterium]|nr:ester cyclase [Actinomycetota bacterium]
MMESMTDVHKALVHRLFEQGFNERATDIFDELIATNYVEHAVEPFRSEEPGKVEGPKHMRSVVEWLVEQFPDVTMTVEVVVAEGDSLVARVLTEGTNLGKLGGVIPPTGKRFSARQSHWYRVHDGKLAEHWATRDDLSAMMQLGVLAPATPPPS